jgi:release factor glutamine methyltransferase
MTTVREILTDAIPQLADAGIDSARLDAEVLLAHVVGRQRGWLWSHPEQSLSTEQTRHFTDLLTRRRQREPLAYQLGEWEFYGRAFVVSADVLVPRPETELLVEAALAWLRRTAHTTIADIGTGSGAIAVTLAAELPALQVIATDLSPHALEVARSNAQRHGVEERITFLEGDLTAPLIEAGCTPVDVLVANLPYIADEEFPGLMPEVRVYEPPTALLAGKDGLDLIRRLITESPAVLGAPGLLAMETGAGQASAVANVCREHGWREVCIIDDYAGIPRHVLAER